MKKILLLFYAMAVFGGCSNDDNIDPIVPEPEFSVLIADTIYIQQGATEIPVHIQSNISDINIKLAVLSKNAGSQLFGRYVQEYNMYGISEEFYLESRDTTVILTSFARDPRGKAVLPLSVYIYHESMRTAGANTEWGTHVAQSNIAMLWEAPVIRTINMDVENLSSNACNIVVNQLNALANVYTDFMDHGLCLSKEELPDMSDLILKPSKTYILRSPTYQAGYEVTIEEGTYYTTTFSLEELEPETTYYARFYLSNGKTSYSEQISFTTPAVGSIPDHNYTFNEIGVEYIADNGLTVKVNSIEKTEIENSKTSYKVTYTQTNNTLEKIMEGNFRIYSLTGDEEINQTGFFNYLFPGESRVATFTFNVLFSTQYHILEFNSDFFDNKPNTNKLMWELE